MNQKKENAAFNMFFMECQSEGFTNLDQIQSMFQNLTEKVKMDYYEKALAVHETQKFLKKLKK